MMQFDIPTPRRFLARRTVTTSRPKQRGHQFSVRDGKETGTQLFGLKSLIVSDYLAQQFELDFANRRKSSTSSPVKGSYSTETIAIHAWQQSYPPFPYAVGRSHYATCRPILLPPLQWDSRRRESTDEFSIHNAVS